MPVAPSRTAASDNRRMKVRRYFCRAFNLNFDVVIVVKIIFTTKTVARRLVSLQGPCVRRLSQTLAVYATITLRYYSHYAYLLVVLFLSPVCITNRCC